MIIYIYIYIYIERERERERARERSHGSGTRTLCALSRSAIREEEVETVGESTKNLQSNSNLFTGIADNAMVLKIEILLVFIF